jgi:hypothetical protein
MLNTSVQYNCCTLCATLSHRKCESVISIDTAAAGIKQSTKAVDLSNELQQKSKHIDEMIENFQNSFFHFLI